MTMIMQQPEKRTDLLGMNIQRLSVNFVVEK